MSNNDIYFLRITDSIKDIVDTYHFAGKPSIATIRSYIGNDCSFRLAEVIYTTEPTYFEWEDLGISFYKIGEKVLDMDINEEEACFEHSDFETDDIIKFIDEFQEKYEKELEEFYKTLYTPLSIRELLYDYYTVKYYEDTKYNMHNFKEFVLKEHKELC